MKWVYKDKINYYNNKQSKSYPKNNINCPIYFLISSENTNKRN